MKRRLRDRTRQIRSQTRARSPAGIHARPGPRIRRSAGARMAIATQVTPSVRVDPLAERIDKPRAVDTDVHNDLPAMAELKPFLAREWHAWIDGGGPGFAARAYANTGSGVMDDSVREED